MVYGDETDSIYIENSHLFHMKYSVWSILTNLFLLSIFRGGRKLPRICILFGNLKCTKTTGFM